MGVSGLDTLDTVYNFINIYERSQFEHIA